MTLNRSAAPVLRAAQSPDYGQRVQLGSTIKVWFDEADTVNSDVAP